MTDYEVALEFAQPVGSLPEPPKFGTKPVQAHPLNEAGRHVVSQYPNLSKHQHYSEKSTADKIVRILNAQIFAGGLKRSGGGKINRRLITTELGLHNTVYRRYRQIIEDYENEVGGKESVAETKIPAMRRWLEQQMDRGTLLIRDGKVSRNQLFDEFDFVKTSTVLIRYPRVAELVQEFDKRVVETHYQPKEIGEKLRKLRELLEEPPVGKDGQTIDRTALATLLDLPPRGISTRPYIEFITIADEKLRDRLKNDPLLAFVGGRVFKFHSMVEQGWSHSFASRFKASFERLYRKMLISTES